LRKLYCRERTSTNKDEMIRLTKQPNRQKELARSPQFRRVTTPVDRVMITIASSSLDNQGGWACMMRWPDFTREMYGWESGATSNCMVIQAAVEGLRLLREPCDAAIISNAKYVQDGFKYLGKWIHADWRENTSHPVPNADRWAAFVRATHGHRVTSLFPRTITERADLLLCQELARTAAREHISSRGLGVRRWAQEAATLAGLEIPALPELCLVS
jgi:ribonuclease HI